MRGKAVGLAAGGIADLHHFHVHAAQAVDQRFAGRAGVVARQHVDALQAQVGQGLAVAGVGAFGAAGHRQEAHQALVLAALVVVLQALEDLVLGQRGIAQHVGQLRRLVQVAAAVVAQVHHHILHLLALHFGHGLHQLRLGQQVEAIEQHVPHLGAPGTVNHPGGLHGRRGVLAGAQLDLAVLLAPFHRAELEAGVLALVGLEEHAVQLVDLFLHFGVHHVDALAGRRDDPQQPVTPGHIQALGRGTRSHQRHPHITRHLALQNAQVHTIAADGPRLRLCLPVGRGHGKAETVLARAIGVLLGRKQVTEPAAHAVLVGGLRVDRRHHQGGRHFLIPEVVFLQVGPHEALLDQPRARAIAGQELALGISRQRVLGCALVGQLRRRSQQDGRAHRRIDGSRGRGRRATAAAATTGSKRRGQQRGNSRKGEFRGVHATIMAKATMTCNVHRHACCRMVPHGRRTQAGAAGERLARRGEQPSIRPSGEGNQALASRLSSSPGRLSAGCSGGRPRIMSEAFSAIISVEALVLTEGSVGMIEASTTRRPCRP